LPCKDTNDYEKVYFRNTLGENYAEKHSPVDRKEKRSFLKNNYTPNTEEKFAPEDRNVRGTFSR